jgi:hypothetical protein
MLIGLSPEYPKFVWYSWHFIFASCDFIAALLILQIHRRESIPVGFPSLSFMVTFVAFCFVQAARYLDLVVLDTNLLETGHRLVVNTLNFGLLVFLCHPAYMAAKSIVKKAAA